MLQIMSCCFLTSYCVAINLSISAIGYTEDLQCITCHGPV
uniref:Uncharacterized protein n=1 Tax=Anguilla anguilla TaxID=7936 RepID=A0A0E9RN55_ANGAN